MSLLDRLFTRTAPAAAQTAIVLAPEAAPEIRPETFATFGALAKAFPPSLASRDYREIADAREVAFGGGDSWDRLPFRDLRLLADNADLLRLAIEAIVGTIKGVDWSLVTEDGSDPDPKAEALLLKPDGKLNWDAWAAMAIEEILVCDNLCLFPYYQGGRLVRLEVIDGATITPKLDAGGRIPDPPAIAFEQSTSNSNGGPKKFTTQQLWYRPQRRRVYSVRGFSPTEQVAARAAVNFHKLLRDLYRWQKGGTPAGLVPAPDGIGTLEQLQTYQAWLDQRLKEPGADSRLQAVMGGTSKYFPTPPPRIDKEHEELLIRTIFSAFGVDPTAMVSQVNYSTADALAAWASLRGMRPHLFALQGLANEMLAAGGFPGHELRWKVEQEAMAAERRQSQLERYKSGLVAWEDMTGDEGESIDPKDVAKKHYFVIGLPAQPFDPLNLEPKPEPSPPPPAGVVPPQLAAQSQQAPPAALGKAIREDLRRWETVVRKAVSAGKPLRDFHSDVIPQWQQETIRKALAGGMGEAAFKARKFGKNDVKRAADSERMLGVLPTLQAAALAIIKQQGQHFAALAMEEAAKAASTATKATRLLPVHGPANVSVTVAEFRSLVRALYDAFSSGVDDSADLLGYGALSGTTAMDYAIQRAGDLIGRTYSEKTGTWIDNPNERWQLLPETRDRVDSVLQQGLDGQWTEKQLRDALNEVINDDARAAMIARTEGAMAYNEGTARNWQGQGVEWVKILDDEGPNSCDACTEANGQVWTMDEFLANAVEHPNCLVGGTLVLAGDVTAVFLRPFHGEVVILRTAADDLLTCTPNHPVLTDRGWVAAGELKQGDNVVRCRDLERVAFLLDPDDHQVPVRIEDVVNAVLETGGVVPAVVPCTPEAFHGDGASSDVYIVGTRRLGERAGDPVGLDHSGQAALVGAGVTAPELLPDGAVGEVLGGSGAPSDGVVGGLGDLAAEGGVPIGIGEAQGLALSPQSVSATSEKASQTGTMQPDLLRQLVGAFASEVAPIKLVEVKREAFTGHVYNLQTAAGWYVANGIIAHNCVRAAVPAEFGEEVGWGD